MCIALAALEGCCRAADISARFLPAYLPAEKPGSEEIVALAIWSDQPGKAKVALHLPAGITAEPSSMDIEVAPASKVLFFKVRFTELVTGGSITATADSKEIVAMEVGRRYDLLRVIWKARLDKEGVGLSQGWMKPDFDDSGWDSRRLPAMWQDIGVTCLRTRIFIPGSWRNHDVFLYLEAVDDNDICYLNGVQVGETDGWDIPRTYKLPMDKIVFGEENLLCIAVENVNGGGGLYRSQYYLGIAEPNEKFRSPELAKPGRIGPPMPFRPMHVEDGVLRYPDGGEVALWGVNYYPQSWYQFDNMKRLGVGMKKAIRDDLDDMRKMGVEVIRIHVFDREISDGAGNLIENEHLDLLDCLISEASKRGIYFFFTPIAWWGGPNENKDSFSARCPKEYMFCDDETLQAEANYYKNWLNHVNRYTGRKYKDEPAICALEIMNEPAYADYARMTDPNASHHDFDREKAKPFKARLNDKWLNWCKSNGIEPEPRFFPVFRYELMSHYLDMMYRAIRHTGAKQPIATAIWDLGSGDDLMQAIADSRCEAITTGLYAGDWNKVGDGWNYLAFTGNRDLDVRLDKKARLVYEHDAIKTFGSYFYPAAARHFRHYGVQICCMFQYDSIATAEWNTDWDAHYLNWLYTPGKSVSFAIGGNAFHELPRGTDSNPEGAEQSFGNCFVSFDRNMSVYSHGDSYLASAPSKSGKFPEKPRYVMAVGDSPYAQYSGTGIYTLEMDYGKRTGTLTINPDADIVGDPWHPRADRSAVVLKDRTHPFTFDVPGVTLKAVRCSNENIAVQSNTFDAVPGTYSLEWTKEK